MTKKAETPFVRPYRNETAQQYQARHLDYLIAFEENDTMHLVSMLVRCESPIETYLGARLFENCSDEFFVWPQVALLNFRVDFLIEVECRGGSEFIVVECDGHDFHEKTKEQAARDKARDRALTTAGFSILRFTGSEIFWNPNRCLDDVLMLAASLRKRARG